MKRIKPINIMNQQGVTLLEKEAVLEGTRELLRSADVRLPIRDFGVWRSDGSIHGRRLVPYQSVDWYIERGKVNSRNNRQLDARAIHLEIMREPWRKPSQGGEDHYDILIVNEDMYSGDTRFVIGLGTKGFGTTFSTYRFKTLKDRLKYECIKTETMHELGHVFGLIPQSRTQNVKESLGKHCTNICIMRQGLQVPHDWIRISKDRLKYGALCSDCLKDLKDYFVE